MFQTNQVIVVVPTFNRLELFKRAVQSVLDQTMKPDFFLILDNNCTDGTSEYLESLVKINFTESKIKIEVFRKSENIGASAGMRFLLEKALQKSTSSWIWIMDDDGNADPRALESLLKSKEITDPETYILASTIVDFENNWSPPNRPARFNSKNFSFEGLSEKEFLDAEKSHQNILVNTSGYCGLLIRSKALAEFGLPRSEFYLWYDDIDFVMRVSEKKKVFLVPDSRIQHFAQALVPHEVRWPFRAPLPKIPEKLLWRYYYLNRNWLWMAKEWLPTHKYFFFWFKHMLRNLLGPIILKQDRLAYRLSLALRAGIDALFNRLGKRVEPS